MPADRSAVGAYMRRLQTRHVDAAQYAVRQREKGLEPNTVQYSARIIGIFPQPDQTGERQRKRLFDGGVQIRHSEQKVRTG